jgi:ribosome-associated heat shock protein Hsp15
MNDARQRIDKWLVYARIVKTRSQAVGLIEGGRVRVNKERVHKASHSVGLNDVLTLSLDGQVKVLQIAGVGDRRGPPQEARCLYVGITDQQSPDISALDDATRQE